MIPDNFFVVHITPRRIGGSKRVFTGLDLQTAQDLVLKIGEKAGLVVIGNATTLAQQDPASWKMILESDILEDEERS